MDAETAELRRRLEGAERRYLEEHQLRLEEQSRRERAEQRLEETRPYQPTTLINMLTRCHQAFSGALQVEESTSLATQGSATDPVNRLFPRKITPWLDFSQTQERTWGQLQRSSNYNSQRHFPSEHDIAYISSNLQQKPIDSELALQYFERETVDSIVEKVLGVLANDDYLKDELGIQGRVGFYDRTTTVSWGEVVETKDGSRRRRNRRADRFCMTITDHEHKKPIYAVEFKAPHKLTITQLIAGLHEVDLERDIVDKESETFEFHATRLVAAVVTQIFSYMHDSGVQYGCIRTGEAFLFLHIPEDPTIVEYHLCIPGREVKEANESNLHQTAVGRLLGFTLEASNAEAPSQEWRSTAREQLSTWKVEYFDILRNIAEICRKEPPTSNYPPSNRKPSRKKHNTRSRARCNPDVPNRKLPHLLQQPLVNLTAQRIMSNDRLEVKKENNPTGVRSTPRIKRSIRTAPWPVFAVWPTGVLLTKSAPIGNSTAATDTGTKWTRGILPADYTTSFCKIETRDLNP